MNDGQLQTIEQVKQFLGGNEEVEFQGIRVKEKYAWIGGVLIRFGYLRLKKADKGVLRQYIQKVTGYSRAQVSRLVAKYKKTGDYRKQTTGGTVSPASIPFMKWSYWPEPMNCMAG